MRFAANDRLEARADLKQERSIWYQGRKADFRCGCETSVQLEKKRTFNMEILCESGESRHRIDFYRYHRNNTPALQSESRYSQHFAISYAGLC